MNFPAARAALDELAKEKNAAALKASAQFLGFLTPEVEGWIVPISVDEATAKRIEYLLQIRSNARLARNFAKSDLIREMLGAAGIVVEDGKVPAWRPSVDAFERGWQSIIKAAESGHTKHDRQRYATLAVSRDFVFADALYNGVPEAQSLPNQVDVDLLDWLEDEARS